MGCRSTVVPAGHRIPGIRLEAGVANAGANHIIRTSTEPGAKVVFDRDTQLLSLASLALAMVLWGSGGVLLTSAVARPPRRERLIVGLATGLLDILQ
jgi:hypothetical protein